MRKKLLKIDIPKEIIEADNSIWRVFKTKNLSDVFIESFIKTFQEQNEIIELQKDLLNLYKLKIQDINKIYNIKFEDEIDEEIDRLNNLINIKI